MNASELIKAGKLSEARASLAEQVKSSPADLSARFLLFQVLVYLGEWERAERHLEISAMQAPDRESFFQLYQNLLAAERARLEVEEGKRSPDFMSVPPLFTHHFISARSGLLAGRPADFTAVLGSMEEELDPVSGVADGVTFESFADCDPGTFWFLEAFVHDRYLWFPFSSLREIAIHPPMRLLDLLWAPASLVTRDGITTDCYLPVLYPRSAAHDSDYVRLGRVTEWKELGDGYCRGIGQHLLQVGDEEKGLLELRTVTFNTGGSER